MARIPDEQIERLKQEVSVQRLAEARGVVLKKRGQDLVGLCPFHEDREPSLMISKKSRSQSKYWRVRLRGAIEAGDGRNRGRRARLQGAIGVRQR
jgi:hypothetical protein